jgi:hypothetical protein
MQLFRFDDRTLVIITKTKNKEFHLTIKGALSPEQQLPPSTIVLFTYFYVIDTLVNCFTVYSFNNKIISIPVV